LKTQKKSKDIWMEIKEKNKKTYGDFKIFKWKWNWSHSTQNEMENKNMEEREENKLVKV
jgi:hypothetical protein